MTLGDSKVWCGIGLSGVSGGPLNSLEIIARDHTGAAYTGKSGLRFRQLTSASSVGISPYGKVLTVDASGDVLLTDYLGYGKCSTPFSLSTDISMSLNNYNIYYAGIAGARNPLDMKDAVGLGFSCSDVLPGKLSVNQSYTSGNVDNATVAGYFHNGDVTTDASPHF
jgi:hypothetical protein